MYFRYPAVISIKDSIPTGYLSKSGSFISCTVMVIVIINRKLNIDYHSYDACPVLIRKELVFTLKQYRCSDRRAKNSSS